MLKKEVFISKLLKWYITEGRHDLPWRKTKDPWHTLIASLLLRKTTTKQVQKLYPLFISRFSTPSSLANANQNEVENMLRPLGMERVRARILIKLAKTIIEEFSGKVPSSPTDLKKLPGVGNYAVSEVLCVSFGKDEPMLDRNMIRVLERVFSARSVSKRPHTDSKMWDFARQIVPKGKAREYNYAVMDFASKICTAKNPKCHICPLNDICDYYNIKNFAKGGYLHAKN